MPRGNRILSRTDIYHVMIRGINRQKIFDQEADYRQFLVILGECKEISGFDLYAFCLMPNHVHLLLKVNDEPLEYIFKRIGSRYAVWYNKKHQRVGHLFQDRFKSENVEDQAYFLTALRYIIQNPMKAGLEKEPGTYRWSSFRAYQLGKASITDIQTAVDIIGSREQLVAFLKEPNLDQALEMTEPTVQLTDEEAKAVMMSKAKCTTAEDFQALPPADQRRWIVAMYREGVSPVQIVNLTGKARATVYRLIDKD